MYRKLRPNLYRLIVWVWRKFVIYRSFIDLLPSPVAQVNKIYNFAGRNFPLYQDCMSTAKRTILRGTIAINILETYTKCILSHVMTLTLSLDPIVGEGHGYTWCARVFQTERAYAGRRKIFCWTSLTVAARSLERTKLFARLFDRFEVRGYFQVWRGVDERVNCWVFVVRGYCDIGFAFNSCSLLGLLMDALKEFKWSVCFIFIVEKNICFWKETSFNMDEDFI